MCFTGIEAAGHQRNAVEGGGGGGQKGELERLTEREAEGVREGGREGGREEASVREGGL